MREEKVIKNAAVGVVGQILTMLSSFVCRMVFVRLLSQEYLGAEGLFSNILTILSLSELGIGTAIIYYMYEPIAKNDNEKTLAFLQLYKKLYYGIGTVILVTGLLITPYITYFVNEIPEGFSNLHLIFVLYVINLAATYFFAHKRTIIEANQNMYVLSTITYSFTFIQHILQIVLLILFRNFIVYLVTQVSITWLQNVIISYYAKKMYPFIEEESTYKLEKKDISGILNNIKAMFMHRIGNAVVNGTDNILITKFVGLAQTGINSNYSMILRALAAIFNVIFNGITASVGNLNALEDKKKVYNVFKKLYFFDAWIYTWASVCLFILSKPFISILFGEGYLFSTEIVLVIAINFYLSGMRQVTLRFRDAMGLFYKDRYKAVVESIINLVASLYLVQDYGIFGVFLGTTISTLLTSIWVEPYILYKYGFDVPFFDFVKITALYFFQTIVIGGIVFVIAEGLGEYSMIDVLVLVCVCMLVPNILLVVLWCKNEMFAFWFAKVLQRVKR